MNMIIWKWKCLFVLIARCRTLAKYCHNIEQLDLSECKKITDISTESISSYCSKLTSINFESCSIITDNSLKFISDGCSVSHAVRNPPTEISQIINIQSLSVHFLHKLGFPKQILSAQGMICDCHDFWPFCGSKYHVSLYRSLILVCLERVVRIL